MDEQELAKVIGHTECLARFSQTLRVKTAILAAFPYLDDDVVSDAPYVGGLAKILRLTLFADVAASIANLAWDKDPRCPSVTQLLDKYDKERRAGNNASASLEAEVDAIRAEMDSFSTKHRNWLKGLRDRLVSHFDVAPDDGGHSLRVDYLSGEERPADELDAAKAFLVIVQRLHDVICGPAEFFQEPSDAALGQAAKALWASFSAI